MYTGIVEELGSVVSLEDLDDAVRLTVRGPLVTSDAAVGDSISVDGCCLTVTTLGPAAGSFTADVMHETLAKTSLGAVEPGARVNLERAVTPTTRLGGHIVQGHVDGTGTVLEGTGLGDSIAVNGVCLTVVRVEDGAFTADAMKETLDRSSLGSLEPGSKVNLERPVRLSDRLGGHLVQGHVDGVGTILSREPGERWDVVTVSLPAHLSRYLVDKGSITVDGISLTVAEVDAESFTVSLIPETLARTTLGFKQPGDRVNLEVDVIAKYVEKMVKSDD
jgi:riboflavin synthase